MEARRQGHRNRLLNSMKAKGLGACKQIALRDLQKLVRMRNADRDGMVRCVTCPARKHWKEMNGGHFVPGRRNGVCFDERNIHPQCIQCNLYKSGRPAEYRFYMVKRYGQDVVDELERLDRLTVTLTRDDYADLCMAYRDRIKEQERRLKEAM